MRPVDESPEDREARRWLAEVYQGDRVRQLSVRSIVSGMLIGAVMSISNLYVGLKTGWGLGVTITACIIAFAVFKALEAVIPAYRKDHFTILENNTMSSAASAAGYMASAGLVSAFPALFLVTGRTLLWWEMMLWLGAVSCLGVFMAVPLKRQLINIDQLPFPSGIATAETLRSMHSAGAEALQKAKALLFGALGGAVLALWRDAPFMGKFAFPGSFPLFPGAKGKKLEDDLTLGFEGSLIMVAAGAIMGIRVGVSLLIGAIFYYGILGPVLIDQGMAQPGYRGLVSWVLWPATAMMVTSGLLAFALRWRTVIRAFSSLGSVFGKKSEQQDPLAHIEVPGSWFVWGTLISGAACVLMGHYLFEITWWMGIVAVLATFMLSIVAARATGETDVTPVGAMGKITQLVYGVVAPTNMTTNLMTASITAGAASHSADLLTDLKSGYMLGGNPRKQTIAQLFGVLAGTLLCVPVYTIVARPEKLGTAELPAPAAKVWAAVAEMLAKGLDALPPGAVMGMVIGGVVGIIITLGEEYFPKYRKWIPSATGLGIAGVIPAYNSISMFLGAFAAWMLMKKKPAANEKYTVAVASGLIAGESLMGVAIILALQGPGMIREILAHFGF
ncbi:Oligopeptide transporter, OPT family [Vulgatibacter incomptus]|uniref:Oligopeptide transporter, OPT family n=1 Tax=Vulgatibacter incomptus TaxID=1391653 RepID=A0A0K1PFW2_9BACT|nr:Oligopeptide transporter, OPT family [Vulgatibacter incomptus]